MLERLGHVLGWAGNLLAVLALIGTGVFFFSLRNNEKSEAQITHADPFLVPAAPEASGFTLAQQQAIAMAHARMSMEAYGMTLPDYLVLALGCGVALVIFLIGRALRYVFVGPKPRATLLLEELVKSTERSAAALHEEIGKRDSKEQQ